MDDEHWTETRHRKTTGTSKDESLGKHIEDHDLGVKHKTDKAKGFRLKPLSQFTWIAVIVLYCGIIFCTVYFSFLHLPKPKTKAAAKKGDFIEEIARSHLETIVGFGHRPSGSIANEIDTLNYILQSTRNIEKQASPSVKFEVDVQHPTGSFAINFLTGFASYYTNITNTIVRISPVNGASKHALLLNCHTDSVTGVPGASDDAVACAVLLEVMRALTVEQKLLHPVIFLFNGAEENILQASHGFVTKHPWAKEVKAFINLEAAGAGGKEVVFQTGPSNPWLAMAWAAHAPHPFGTIVGQELFQSGMIPADTDFRIFRDYGHIPGIDLAYIRNGYVYHTIYDNMDMIPPGSIQRAGDNILAVVEHLVKSKSSLLPNPSVYKHGATAFLDFFGLYMLIMPMRLVVILNWFCSVGGLLFIMRRIVFSKEPGFAIYGKQLIKAVGTVVLSWVACFLSVLLISGLITMLGRSMSFYSKPSLVVLLYVVPGFLSMVTVYHVVKSQMFKNEDPWKLESLFFDASLFIWCALLFNLNYLKVHSSFILLLCVAPVLLVRCFVFKNWFRFSNDSTPQRRLLIYLAALLPHSVIMMNHVVLVMEFFIPILNRIGSEAPPDLVIGIFTAIFLCLFFHFALSTVYTVKSIKGLQLVLLALFLLGFLLACSPIGFPYSYTPSHPITKRVYVQHTSREFYRGTNQLVHTDSGLWVNTMDYPGFDVDMGSKSLAAASHFPCTGLYCHSPWLIPIHHVIRNSRYVPAEKPSSARMKNPLIVKVIADEMTLIRENSTTRIYKKYLSFAISGPSHMSVQIGTLMSNNTGSFLTRWSLDGAINDVISSPLSKPSEKGYEYDGWYFIYYGAGLDPFPWQPWFEFLVYRDKSVDVNSRDTLHSVEFGFSAHLYPDERVIPIPGQTQEIRSMLTEFHNWVMAISWISCYKNYLF